MDWVTQIATNKWRATLQNIGNKYILIITYAKELSYIFILLRRQHTKRYKMFSLCHNYVDSQVSYDRLLSFVIAYCQDKRGIIYTIEIHY